MPFLFSCVALLLAALVVERVRLDRSRDAVALRIAVTGTRGKTTVVRLLASVLRESGRTVVAKTTGSEPTLVLPDGSVERIARRGPASILEQKALLHRAARLHADAVVVEVMSIHAENHRVEGRRLLVPHLVLATNFLPDHVEAQGNDPYTVGAVLALAVPPGATVLVGAGACPESFREGVAGAGGALMEVEAGAGAAFRDPPGPGGPPSDLTSFTENLDLVVAAAHHLGVDDGAIRRGIVRARPDLGALRVWRARAGGAGAAAPVHLVSAFAANDPGSTMRVYDETMASLEAVPRGPGALRRIGLLSLRPDRGDRTLQWADALSAGLVERFDALLVTGLHAPALARRVLRGHPGPPPVTVLPRASAGELTRAAVDALGPGGGMVFGFGNIGGVGAELVDLWSRTGEALTHGD